jgi:uncharacterized protein RhaS with RHS repeats
MQARYYDPVIGRFYSNDPIGFTGEVDTFNRYSYVANNPYKYVDPNGMEKYTVSFSVTAVWGTGFEIGKSWTYDTTHSELTTVTTVAAKGGAGRGASGSFTSTDSPTKATGNSSKVTGELSGDVEGVLGSLKVDRSLNLASFQVDENGLKNTTTGLVTGSESLAVGGLEKGGEMGLGASVTGTAKLTIENTISIPETLEKIKGIFE